MSERLKACQKPTHIANTMNNPLIVQVCSKHIQLLVILCSICGNFSENGADYFSIKMAISILKDCQRLVIILESKVFF